MKLTYFFTMTAVASIALSGCGLQQKNVSHNTVGTVKTETTTQTEAAIQKVLYGSWAVVDVNGMKVEGTDRPYIEFAEDTANPFLVKCYAYNGCNYLNGEYAVTPGGSMKPTTEFINTMRMCPDAQYEMGVTLGITGVSAYKIEKVQMDYLLYMMNSSGQTLLTLRKYDTDFINGAWKITSINGTSVDPEAELQIEINLDDKTIHGNAGCNVFNGKVTTNSDVQNSLSFTDVATTRMTCPQIQLEQTFLSALARVASIAPAPEGAEFRDAAGQSIMTLMR